MFKIHKEEIEINGKKITLETGKIARQADGAIIATCGETVVKLLDLFSVFKPIKGTPKYWQTAKYELVAKVKQG